ncbi:MAG: retropepsin-like domain-containing protein [Deltaproteobacteria bacterium]|nr:retropepsin-like domain-containing protein [Kofleriaceae bacterium]
MTPLRVALASLIVTASCAGGAPPGFSSGDAWVFPLVGPLENGVLITPVMLGGEGPFLFVIDPDASASSIDESLAGQLGLHTSLGPRLIDESDTSRPTRIAEVPAMTVGTLTVKGRVVTLHPNGAYVTDGRAIRGVIGRDVVADSLVFGFDRDAGVAFLATREAFAPPANAMRIPYGREIMKRGDNEPNALGGPTGTVPRRVAKAKVNGVAAELHLDLGAVQSQLAAGRWKASRLAPVPYKASAIDEVATARNVDKAGIANHVELGAASAMGLVMIAYGDRRFDEEDVHGTLGLNFFAPYKVWADWHDSALYLAPRDGDAEGVAERIARWDAPVLASCKEPACASARCARRHPRRRRRGAPGRARCRASRPTPCTARRS